MKKITAYEAESGNRYFTEEGAVVDEIIHAIGGGDPITITNVAMNPTKVIHLLRQLTGETP